MLIFFLIKKTKLCTVQSSLWETGGGGGAQRVNIFKPAPCTLHHGLRRVCACIVFIRVCVCVDASVFFYFFEFLSFLLAPMFCRPSVRPSAFTFCDGTNFPPMYFSVSQVVLWPIKAFEACWPTTRKSSSKAWDDSLTCIICVSRSVCVCVCVFCWPGARSPPTDAGGAAQRGPTDRPTDAMAAAALFCKLAFWSQSARLPCLPCVLFCFFHL